MRSENEPGPTRHLAPDTLDALWNGAVPVVLPIAGTPFCQIRLDPARGELALITSYEVPEPDVAKFRHLQFQGFLEAGEEQGQVTASVEESPRGAYTLLTAIVDQLQLEQQPLAMAVAIALETHGDLIASRRGMTMETQVGLYGELLLLEHLIADSGAGEAVASWVGPLSEEHDFVLSATTVEVKTTTTERRRHVIHGLTQLVPTGDLPLHFVSVQVTMSTAPTARSLPQLVESVQSATGPHAGALGHRLRAAGWADADADLYTTSWALRSLPRAYLVNQQFPALTPDRVGPSVPNFGLVSDVSYRIDVTELPPVDGPGGLSEFVDSIESERS